MSVFLLKDPECVFIHIPKTGGTSIRMGIWQGRYLGPHWTIAEGWRLHFKFAFVRHPLDRFVSAFRMCTEGPRGYSRWHHPADWRPLNINEFAEIVFDESIIYDQRRASFSERIRHHTIPQTHPFYLLKAADFIGRYENYENDIRIITENLKIYNPIIPLMNYTIKKPWQDYLSGALLRRCIDFYKSDFEQLKYDI